jgi:hypothetical protein
MVRSSWLACCLFLTLLLAGCRPLPLMGYPYFWDYTTTKPNDLDMVGGYRILKIRLEGDLSNLVQEKAASINLRPDHSVVFIEVPEFDESGQKLVCRMSGSARWKLDDKISSDQGWSVEFQDFNSDTESVPHECNPGQMAWGVFVLGRHAPHRLYTVVGDPDNDSGIEYQWVGP